MLVLVQESGRALLVLATLVFLISKCFFLAPTRLGWLLMVTNILYETAYKRLRLERSSADAVLLPVLVGGWWMLGGAGWAAGAATLLALVWGGALFVDIRWRSGSLARQHRDYRDRAVLPVPQLVAQIRGPILRRRRRGYEVGVMVEGETLRFEVIVLNPSVVVPQLPLVFETHCQGDGLRLTTPTRQEVPCPEPEGSTILPIELSALAASGGGEVQVRLQHGDWQFERRLVISRVLARQAARPVAAEISRWKFGCRGAFAWRGDHDLFDQAAFQSIEGWKMALGLSRRFQLPSTVFLSARLSLIEAEHRAYCEHFGWDRRSAGIPDFIRFVREQVELRVDMEWPWRSARPYYAELGNHMYLHYGTEAAAAPENAWTFGAAIGAARYPWMTSERGDSLAEQRDNAQANDRVFDELFQYRAASYAIPSDVYDEHTAPALEAAGLEVGSDTDASRFTRVFRLPAPHHPVGCRRFVELTRKYPRDPQDAYQLATLKYWLHAARRTGRAFVFLAHHHLLRYEGVGCYHMTEELLRSVLADCEGDVYPATVGALGRYWRDVLSPRTGTVRVELTDGGVNVRNEGPSGQQALPVELTFSSGERCLRLLDVGAGQTGRIEFGMASGEEGLRRCN